MVTTTSDLFWILLVVSCSILDSVIIFTTDFVESIDFTLMCIILRSEPNLITAEHSIL